MTSVVETQAASAAGKSSCGAGAHASAADVHRLIGNEPVPPVDDDVLAERAGDGVR